MEHMTSATATRFLPSGFSPGLAEGLVPVTSDFHLDGRSNFGKRVRPTKKTRTRIPVHDSPAEGVGAMAPTHF